MNTDTEETETLEQSGHHQQQTINEQDAGSIAETSSPDMPLSGDERAEPTHHEEIVQHSLIAALTSSKPQASEIDTTADPSPELLLQWVPEEGTITKEELLSKANHAGIGLKRAKGFLAQLLKTGMLQEWRIPRKGTKSEIHLVHAVPSEVGKGEL